MHTPQNHMLNHVFLFLKIVPREERFLRTMNVRKGCIESLPSFSATRLRPRPRRAPGVALSG